MKEKSILKNNKKYTVFDYIKIPLKSCPVCTLIIGINRIVSAFIPSILVLITADFIDTALDIFNGVKAFNDIYLTIFMYMLVIVFQNLNYTLIYGFVNIRYDMAIYHHVRAAMAEKRGRLKYKYIEDNKAWDLMARTCDNSLVGIAIGMNNVFDIIELFISVISVLLILMSQVWWAAVAVILVAVPLIIVALKGGSEAYDAGRKVQKHSRMSNYYHDVLTKREFVEERSLFGYAGDVNDKWYDKYELVRKEGLKVTIRNQIKMRISSIVTLAVAFGIIGILLIPTINNEISIGIFIALTNATFEIVGMMSWRLTYVASTFAEKQEYLKDLTEFMAMEEEEEALSEPADNMFFENVEFKNVSFRYPGTDKYILKDFNLKLSKNKHYAFVGVNGAGKTTITKLLTGMYRDYEGDILINGKNLKEYGLAQLKGMFSVVYQDFAKYQIKAEDNIVMGDIRELNKLIKGQSYDMLRREKIIKEIDLEKVINKLPNGINTYLGKIKEEGIDLSGGEWQRVAVARSLYSRACVRILDEPTAALDPVAESNVYKMFGRISEGKTTIFITHRLGAARLADEIVVVDNGKVAEFGNHDSLMSMNGIYAEMFESQKSWYEGLEAVAQ